MRSLIVRINLVLRTSPLLVATAWAAPPAAGEAHANEQPRSVETEVSAAEHAPAAPSTAEAEATALFEQGRMLFEQGDYAAACPLFEQSLERMAGVGTKFQLASCYEKQGQKLRARQLFIDVADVTLEAGQLARHDVAKARAEALEAELGSLRLQIEDTSDALSVRVGDETLTLDQLALDFFVEPGEHEVIVRAPGKAEWRKQVTVAATQVVVIEIPALAPEPSAPAREPAPEPEPEAPATAEPVSTEPPPSAYTWVPPVALGIGAVGLFAGLAFTQQYRSSNDDAKQVCPSGHGCTPEEIDRHAALVDDARTARTRAFIGYGMAIAGLAGGVIYYVVRPQAPKESPLHSLHVGPAIGSDSLGGVAYGHF